MSSVKTTKHLVIVACPKSGIIEIYMKRSMKVVQAFIKWRGVGFDENWSTIELLKGE